TGQSYRPVIPARPTDKSCRQVIPTSHRGSLPGRRGANCGRCDLPLRKNRVHDAYHADAMCHRAPVRARPEQPSSGRLRPMPHEALRAILPIASWSEKEAGAVAFTGGSDPVLPTPFRIGTAGAASVVATGLAASELWAARTGRRQQVAVDLRQAAASLRSGHYMRLGDGKISTARNSIMGVYPSRDGRWSYLHCNFPNHRAAALKVLGVAEDREAVARAVASWDAADLEEAII